jgi:hypothetical protein
MDHQHSLISASSSSVGAARREKNSLDTASKQPTVEPLTHRQRAGPPSRKKKDFSPCSSFRRSARTACDRWTSRYTHRVAEYRRHRRLSLVLIRSVIYTAIFGGTIYTAIFAAADRSTIFLLLLSLLLPLFATMEETGNINSIATDGQQIAQVIKFSFIRIIITINLYYTYY